jgi:hypothetical protein
MTNNSEDIKDCYKKGDALILDIMNIRKFGDVDGSTGEFMFIRCQKCDGPKFGHKAKESECSREKYAEEAKEIISSITNLYLFDLTIAWLDKRLIAMTCEMCRMKFKKRFKKEEHIKINYKELSAVSGPQMKQS